MLKTMYEKREREEMMTDDLSIQQVSKTSLI